MPESSGHAGGETLVEQSPVEGPDESGGSGADRRWSAWLPWIIGGAVAVILGIVLTVILIGGHNEPARGRRPAARGSALPALPPGAAFSFANAKVQPVGVRKRVHVPDLSSAAKQIQDSLSVLYDEGLVERSSWTGGPPASVWNVFAPSIRNRARSDSKAFTIGASGAKLTSLQISSSSLTIRFLLDERGHVAGVVAAATIRGDGQMRGAGAVQLLVSGRFVFQQISGRWLIAGYPSAGVTVRSPQGRSPQPGATP